MPNFEGISGFWSILILTTCNLSLSSLSLANSSRTGAICLHGPHHSAQKSHRKFS